MRRILLVRHGESEGNVKSSAYTTMGDPKIGLTETGKRQAQDAGKFLRWYYAQSPADDPELPIIWTSSYERTRQTTDTMLKAMGWENRLVREEIRLIEQSFGAMAWAAQDYQARKELKLSTEAYKRNPYLTPLPHGESLMDNFMRVDSFVGTLHREEDRHGHDDVLIIAHGATIKNFLMRWFHLPDDKWPELTTPHNADVIKIEHDGHKWDARKIYDGQTRRIALGSCTRQPDMGDLIARVKLRSLCS